jgi:hypothetical protein
MPEPDITVQLPERKRPGGEYYAKLILGNQTTKTQLAGRTDENTVEWKGNYRFEL